MPVFQDPTAARAGGVLVIFRGHRFSEIPEEVRPEGRAVRGPKVHDYRARKIESVISKGSR